MALGGLPALPRAGRRRPPGRPAGHPWRPLPRRARPGRELRRAGTPRPRRHPPLPHRDRAAPPGRHRRLRRRDLAACGRRWTRPASPRSASSPPPASACSKCRVMAEAQRADRRGRHRQLHPGHLVARPMPPPISSPMTACRGSSSAASSCCAATASASAPGPSRRAEARAPVSPAARRLARPPAAGLLQHAVGLAQHMQPGRHRLGRRLRRHLDRRARRRA